ncbi:hypothetical protein R69776_03376 [Paraburkholderia nemoris]|uniref:GIY-YIG domain-containing protein n=1 Tax=Paraburkholderia nemoris TaxID=2793076 RepID=A0ABM8RME8_9BURK|nr:MULTISPECIES: hypothetical protein [Paraburkholderia]CAE6761095.1 hypothetical protein R69776_03376 [Paraburkholderia nemoris]
MEKLTRIGFRPAGQWLLANDQLSLELTGVSEEKNVLYAFVRDGDVQYVGKTTKTLRRRMMGYLKPSSTQKTSSRNHKKIVELLRQGRDVYVFAWADHGLHRYGDFTINLAAALEDSIIETLAPPRNGGRDERVVELSEESDPPDDSDEAKMEEKAIGEAESRFAVEIGKTYFESGFFNVPVRHAEAFGPDKSLLNIYCGKDRTLVPAWVNRRASPKGTPRIMGGAALRDWLQANLRAGDSIAVRVLSQSEIVIE